MTTEPRMRIGVSWALVCASVAMLFTLLIVEYAKGSDFRKAAQWHKVHGSMIVVDGHKLSLPQDWWGRDPSTDGKQVVVKASRSLLKTWQSGIIVGRKGPNEIEADEAGIRKTLEIMIGIENQGKQTPRSSLVVVNAVSTKIYCKRTMIVEPMVELRCDVIGAPTLFTSVGLPNTEEEIEGIISTYD
ncbi:MAG: hypothetical protein P4K86_08215 [Terracidiphilus sp.]|nr:hypothetical protein [Terracidiphilus sp.]MDR3776542.1 hypothetical protein [Terracidiphilus sp.]